jgi:putative membrane protein
MLQNYFFTFISLGITTYLLSVDVPHDSNKQLIINLLLLAILFTLAFSVIKPILKVVAFPITFITFGLFNVFINLFLIKIVDVSTNLININGIVNYLFFTILFSLCQGLFNSFRS